MVAIFGIGISFNANELRAQENKNPNIVLVMTDDQGWGQTGYNQHPILKTPNLDVMAENGLRFDRFYAAAPVCSPTRASALTGRSNDRTGVLSHGYALRRQEQTIASLLKQQGYVTGHFGKWHLNGLRGPGVPILNSDKFHPGYFGFDVWLSVSNFFDADPILSRMGKFEEFEGDSSDIVMIEALDFIKRQAQSKQHFFTVIWFGSPHSPWLAQPSDSKPFDALDRDSQEHYGELVAMDRSIGTLRSGLRELDIEKNTLVWFCSDNGGLPKINPSTVGGLRGHKGTVFEGGLRVPGIAEWPASISPRITQHPASTMDIFPTIVDIVGIEPQQIRHPIDGESLKALFSTEGDTGIEQRTNPIPFRFGQQGALVGDRYKLLSQNHKKGKFELYDLVKDPAETTDLAATHPEITAQMQKKWIDWNDSVEQSVAGKDYAEGRVDADHLESRDWTDVEAYHVYFPEWSKRWEYKSRLNKK